MSGPARSVHAVSGLVDPVRIEWDRHGIPRVTARTEHDVWFGLGYAAATDRLWQLEYDRRRACGRWAEVVGRAALPADRLARRLDLASVARADVAAMDPVTADSFAAYAAGVNTGVAHGRLPPEYSAAGIEWEPWQPWHSVAAFTIRHVLMGVWQYKIARAVLLAREGPEVFELFDPVPRTGMRLTVPPAGRVDQPSAEAVALVERAREEVRAAAAHLGFLAEVEAGSNAWVVDGSRTTTGSPVLCNDSHRALDVPNVYWQVRLVCPSFTVAGGTFPGIPGFPHFGHNGRVGWAITNGAADAQDLLVERFRPSADGFEVLTPDGWRPVEVHRDRIGVRGGDSESCPRYRTPNGPVVHGDPATGTALSLRWTATEEPCRQFGVMRAMLCARDVTELLDAQRDWVDPVNNLLAADVDGNIGYLLRGALPVRNTAAAGQVPVPGWEAASRWLGRVPFAAMPRSQNPPDGMLVSTNNTVLAPSPDLVITHAAGDFYRVERVHELLGGTDRHSPDDLAGYQGDVVSVAARTWSRLLAGRGPYQGQAEAARAMLAAGGGDLSGGTGYPLLHACFRRALAALMLGERVAPGTVDFLLAGGLPGTGVLVRRWFAQLTWPAGPVEPVGAAGRGGRAGAGSSADPMPAELIDDAVLGAALGQAWHDASGCGGTDPARWRWADQHFAAGRHTLAAMPGLPEWPDTAGRGPSPVRGWDPAQVGIGGDAETIQNASYSWPRAEPFTVTNCAVYRQVLDLADLAGSRWIIPGGASADPTSPHSDDQLALWQRHDYVAMHPVRDGFEPGREVELLPP